MEGGVKVSVAFNDTTLEPSPTWTAIDDDNFVTGYTIDRGRQFEFDRTDTGTAIVTINDRDGTLDPTNAAGPYYGLLEPLLQIKIELWDPVASAWSTRFRGFIDEFDYQIDPWVRQNVAGTTVGVTRLRMSCVDLFAILSRIEMFPDGSFGDTPPVDKHGNIFFDNATAQDRITQALGNAGINSALYSIFTMNVYCAEGTYSPGDSVLQPIEDAADAELPTVANVYVDRSGKLQAHGRLAVFDPHGTWLSIAGSNPARDAVWVFRQWHAGDGKAVTASPTTMAHIRQFAYNRGGSRIYNYALCTPQGMSDVEAIDPTAMAAQTKKDSASISQFGFSPWSSENQMIGHPTATGVATMLQDGAGILTGNSAVDECAAQAQFIINNYKEAKDRVTQITFRSQHPSASGAAANWAFLCGVDIADTCDVTVRGPGDSSSAYVFNAEPFLVLGIHEEVKPLNPSYANVTLSLDLAPIPADSTGLE